MLQMDEKQLKSVNSKSNLKKFLEHVHNGNVEKINKMCNKGLDPNFHCSESGGKVFRKITPTKFKIRTLKIKHFDRQKSKIGSTAETGIRCKMIHFQVTVFGSQTLRLFMLAIKIFGIF
jgi:hypothetical protein